jgi:hypothetical protein
VLRLSPFLAVHKTGKAACPPATRNQEIIHFKITAS